MKLGPPIFIIPRPARSLWWFVMIVVLIGLCMEMGGCDPKPKSVTSDPGVRDVIGGDPTEANVKLQIALDAARAENIRLEQDLKAEHERKFAHQSVVDAGIAKMSWFSMASLAGGLIVWVFAGIGGWMKSIPFFIVGGAAAFAPRIVDDPIVHYSAVGMTIVLMVGLVVWVIVKIKIRSNTLKEVDEKASEQADGKRELAAKYDQAGNVTDAQVLRAEAAVLDRVGTKEYDPKVVEPTSKEKPKAA